MRWQQTLMTFVVFSLSPRHGTLPVCVVQLLCACILIGSSNLTKQINCRFDWSGSAALTTMRSTTETKANDLERSNCNKLYLGKRKIKLYEILVPLLTANVKKMKLEMKLNCSEQQLT